MIKGASERYLKAGHLHRLVDIADILRLYICVLLAATNELRKRCQKALNPDAAHVYKLS
jgi:hypothetical protein